MVKKTLFGECLLYALKKREKKKMLRWDRKENKKKEIYPNRKM